MRCLFGAWFVRSSRCSELKIICVTSTIKTVKMIIERTKKEVIIRLPLNVEIEGLQRFVDYLVYKEATANSKAKQDAVDQLAVEVKKDWWKKNRHRFIK